MIRKGLRWFALALLVWLLPVTADESPDEIVAMMGWWEEYGRYWEELGVDVAGDNEMTFALLEEIAKQPRGEPQ